MFMILKGSFNESLKSNLFFSSFPINKIQSKIRLSEDGVKEPHETLKPALASLGKNAWHTNPLQVQDDATALPPGQLPAASQRQAPPVIL